MKFAFILILSILVGCTSNKDGAYRDKKMELQRDITILKLEIRKTHLENVLNGLEGDK